MSSGSEWPSRAGAAGEADDEDNNNQEGSVVYSDSEEQSNHDPGAPSLIAETSNDFASNSQSRNQASIEKRWLTTRISTRHNLWRTLRTSHSDLYDSLFLSSVKDHYTESYHDINDVLPTSQLGAVTWSSEEKAAFFEAVTRYGRLELESIARVCGKSVYEVQAYILLLQADQGVDVLDAVHGVEVPAAVEVSGEVEALLDAAAAATRHREFDSDINKARRELGDIWLLNRENAIAIEEAIDAGDEAEDEAHRVLPSSKLFWVSNWIDLSTHVFMNAGGSRFDEENWRMIATGEETPSIMFDALGEFHALALEITQKIVKNVIAVAERRLNAAPRASSSDQSSTTSLLVRRDDVAQAVESMGLKVKNDAFWIELARRQNLAVLSDDKAHTPANLDYDAVEVSLARRLPSAKRRTYETAYTETYEPRNLTQKRPRRTKYQVENDDEGSDAEAIVLDAEITRRSDYDLRIAMGKPTSASRGPKIDPEPATPMPGIRPRPTGGHRPEGLARADVQQVDLLRWTDHFFYRSEWDSYPSLDQRQSLEEDLLRNRVSTSRKEWSRLAYAESKEGKEAAEKMNGADADVHDEVLEYEGYSNDEIEESEVETDAVDGQSVSYGDED